VVDCVAGAGHGAEGGAGVGEALGGVDGVPRCVGSRAVEGRVGFVDGQGGKQGEEVRHAKGVVLVPV